MTSIYESEYKALIANLKDARKKAGITQADLAEALGRTQPFIAKVEACDRRLDVIEYIKICEAIGISPKRLVS